MRAVLFLLIVAFLVVAVVGVPPRSKVHKLRLPAAKEVVVTAEQKKERLAAETAISKTAKSKRDVSAAKSASSAIEAELATFQKLVATAQNAIDVNYVAIGHSKAGKPLLTYSFKKNAKQTKEPLTCPADAIKTGFDCDAIEETFKVTPSVVKVNTLIEDRRIVKEAQIGACLSTGNLQAGRGDYILTTFHGAAQQGDDLYYPVNAVGSVGWISMIAQGYHVNSEDWDIGYLSSDYCECLMNDKIKPAPAVFTKSAFYEWVVTQSGSMDVPITLHSVKRSKFIHGFIDKSKVFAQANWDDGSKYPNQIRAFFRKDDAPQKGDSGGPAWVNINGVDVLIGLFSSDGVADGGNQAHWLYGFFTPIWDVQAHLPGHINFC